MIEQEAQELIESINLKLLQQYARLLVETYQADKMGHEDLINKVTYDVFILGSLQLKELLAKREIAKLEAQARSLPSSPGCDVDTTDVLN